MPKQKKPAVPPLSVIYRKIAVSFVVLTVLLVGIIIFFSVSKATVKITPKQELKSSEFLVTVKETPDSTPAVIQGKYEDKVVEEEMQFESTGIVEKAGRFEGKLMIVNTTSAAQQLVATTRLISPEGVLFRMKSGTTAPAKGQVEVEVYTDHPDPNWDYAPGTRFIIPGLNATKQALIYGENKERLAGGVQKVRVVTAEDLEKAKTEVIEKATKKMQEEFEKTPAAALGGVISNAEVQEVSADAKKGEERQTFTTKVKMNVQLLAYDKIALEKLALEKVTGSIPSDREMVRFNKDAMVIRIKNVNKTVGEVQLSVYADAEVRLNAASPILDPVKIAGMLPDEAATYLQSFDAVEKVEVDLFPSWQKRIPTIPDRIKMVVKK